MNDELKLVYVNFVGRNSTGQNEYEFFFSETPDTVWGENWEVQCPSVYNSLLPDETSYTEVKRLTTNKDFFCVQQNSCFSMQDCIDGCIALMWFYDRNGDAVVFNFAESKDVVNKKLVENGVSYLE